MVCLNASDDRNDTAREIEVMGQCEGETKSGDRCQRETGDDEQYCWQHGNNGNSAQARAYSFDELTRRKILDSLREGRPLKTAAELAGVSERTAHRWKNNFPDFEEDIRRAKAEGIDTLVGYVEDAAAGNWRAAKFLLEVLDRETFLETEETADTVTEEERKEAREEKIKEILGEKALPGEESDATQTEDPEKVRSELEEISTACSS